MWIQADKLLPVATNIATGATIELAANSHGWYIATAGQEWLLYVAEPAEKEKAVDYFHQLMSRLGGLGFSDKNGFFQMRHSSVK